MVMAIPNGTWFEDVVPKIDDNWIKRWDRLENELTTLKKSREEVFAALEIKQKQTADSTRSSRTSRLTRKDWRQRRRRKTQKHERCWNR